jgi:pyridinium-3,5-biscarboxylic acid mononucleotide synthase
MGAMNEQALRTLLDDVRRGTTSADDAVAALQRLPFADLGDARVDHHRALRQGRPEAVYGPGKSADQCLRIIGELLAHDDSPVVLSRANAEQAETVLAAFPCGRESAGTIVWRAPLHPRPERVIICSGGTADTPVVEECAATLTAYGFDPTVFADVGVAGLHRLLAHRDALAAADAVIVVAGMEGALASVIGGLVAAPVVAVPTSTGYGASLAGVTALLSMLASCASGITVVGIDNGFGAACAIARMMAPR